MKYAPAGFFSMSFALFIVLTTKRLSDSRPTNARAIDSIRSVLPVPLAPCSSTERIVGGVVAEEATNELFRCGVDAGEAVERRLFGVATIGVVVKYRSSG